MNFKKIITHHIKDMELRKFLLIVFAIILFPILARSQTVEYFAKASFIEKFARFTEWEPNVIGENFVIGVIGESPFRSELEKLSKKTKIKDKPVKIVYIKDYQEMLRCQVLFICSSEKDNLQKIINYIGNSNVLLVGDTPGFSENGVHFNFYFKRKETLHFEINIKALVKATLKTDLQLISLGKIVN